MNFYLNNVFFLNLINLYYYKLDYNTFFTWTIFPEFILLLFCLFILMLIVFNSRLTLMFDLICIFLLFLICYYLNLYFVSTFDGFVILKFLFGNFWLFDFYSFFFKFLILGLSVTLMILSKNIIYASSLAMLYEFFLLFLLSIFFMLILMSSTDFFFSYLALEGTSFSLYILSATIYYNKLSLESAVKYFILGGVASCIFLYGISLLFICVNSLDFFTVKLFLSNCQSNWLIQFDLVLVILCFIFTFLFKISAFPCHVWSPDVYEGVWTPITAYFSIVVKSVVFAFFTRIFIYVFSSILIIWQLFMLIAGLGSIIVGCLGALIQRKIKRFLAYTSINQVGFLLVGLATFDLHGVSAAFLFLFIYLVMSILLFGLILNVKHFTEKVQLIYLNDLYTLARSDLTFGNIWVITLFSLAGVPPLAGFFSKFLILTSAINNSFFFSVIIILIFSTISSYYYLNFIRYILFEKKKITNLFFFLFN